MDFGIRGVEFFQQLREIDLVVRRTVGIKFAKRARDGFRMSFKQARRQGDMRILSRAGAVLVLDFVLLVIVCGYLDRLDSFP